MEGIQNPTYGTLGQFKPATDNTATFGSIANGTVISNEAASTEESTKSNNIEELVESVSNRYNVHDVHAL